MKSYETWDIVNIKWLAGFLPSTVVHVACWFLVIGGRDYITPKRRQYIYLVVLSGIFPANWVIIYYLLLMAEIWKTTWDGAETL